MPDWILYFIEDLRDLWNSITFSSIARAGFMSIWGLLLFLPLRGIHREEAFSLLMYALFMVFSGVVLVIVIPTQYTGAAFSLKDQVLTVVIMNAIALMRWTFLADSKSDVDELTEVDLTDS